LVVVPGQDLVILDDLGPPGWTATASRTESFDLQGATPFRGASAAELRAEPSFGGWSLVMRPQEPLATVGYDSLTMALRVHELELPGGPRLTVSASPGPPVSLLDGLLDPDSREWQRVALALGELELEDTLESVSVAGNVRVHLDVDDVRLVSRLQVAANTAVTESFDDTRPADVGLDASYPNPFNSSTVIPFQLPTDAEVDLALFDIVGQRVATLVAGHRRAGLHRAVWDGRDQQDKPLASGVYIVRLNTGGRVEHRKLALLR
jgi:hypothetical protein